MMTFKSALIITSMASLFGVLLGLVIRLLREEVKVRYLYRTCILSLKFLIFYPLTFPILILMNKEEIADMLAKDAASSASKKSRLKIERRLKRTYVKALNFKTAVKIWFELMCNIAKMFDEYVKSNIELAKKLIVEEYGVNSTQELANKEFGTNLIRIDFSKRRKIPSTDIFIENQYMVKENMKNLLMCR